MNIQSIKTIQKYYNGFYITTPAGNNAFSFAERENKQIYVPPIISGKIDELAVGEHIVFSEISEIDDGVEYNRFGLKQFIYTNINGKDICIFDNHNHAFFFWMFALKMGIIKKGLPLVHVDQHSDMREPLKFFAENPQNKDNKIDLQEVFKYTNYVLNVGNFIKPAQKMGLFSEINVIDSSTSLEQSFPNEIVLDIDIDIFSKDMSYIPYELKMDKIKSFIKKAKLITIATSPYFIDQHKAIEIIKEIFDD